MEILRYNFQRLQAPVQPGSMDSEAGVFSITFDMSGTRMITTEADKTIKVYKEDDTAVRINWFLNYINYTMIICENITIFFY